MQEQTFATVLWEKGAPGKFAENSKSAPINSWTGLFSEGRPEPIDARPDHVSRSLPSPQEVGSIGQSVALVQGLAGAMTTLPVEGIEQIEHGFLRCVDDTKSLENSRKRAARISRAADHAHHQGD